MMPFAYVCLDFVPDSVSATRPASAGARPAGQARGGVGVGGVRGAGGLGRGHWSWCTVPGLGGLSLRPSE